MIAALRTSGLDLHGRVVGGVDRRKRRYAAELKKSVAELGLQRDVTFTDHRSDMKEFYAKGLKGSATVLTSVNY